MLTKTKKTLLVSLSVLLLVMLTAFGLSETSFSRKSVKADDETATAVAAIGEEKYETLQAALDVAHNKTVKLLANVKENVTISKTNTTIDLNGFTINGGTEKGKPTITVKNYSFIKDTSEAQTGTVMREDTAENSGVTSHYVIDIQGQASFLTIEGGTFLNNSGNDKGKGASLIRIGDDRYDVWTQLTIKGGKFIQDNFIVIKADHGSLWITGGEINSKNSYAVENWGNSAYIEGGTINGKVSNWTLSGNGNARLNISGGTINGNVSAVNYGSATDSIAKINVTGGTINGELGTYTYDVANKTYIETADKSLATIGVTGGTFSNAVPEEYLAESANMTKGEDETYTVKSIYAAKVGETKYINLQDAIAAAKDGEKVKLLADLTLDDRIVVDKAITIDFDGYTVTSTWAMATGASGNARYALLLNAATEITNGTFKAGMARAIGAYDAMTLTEMSVSTELTDGNACVALCGSDKSYTIKYTQITGAYALSIFANNAKVDIADSALKGNGNVLYHNGTNYGLKLTVRDSAIISSGSCGVYISGSTATVEKGGYQQATFSNCKIKGLSAIEVKYTDLTLNDCTVIATDEKSGYKQNNNGPAAEGFAVVSTDNAKDGNTPAPQGSIKINGGTYTGPVGLGSLASVKETYPEFSDSTVSISDGTFSNEVPKEYIAETSAMTENEDGTYTVKSCYVAQIGTTKYETLQAALDAANNKTVKLLADVNENVTISQYKTTLDLNGFTINGGTEKGKPTITSTSTRATIKDTSVAQTGTVMREDTAENSGKGSHYVIDVQGNKAFLCIEGGTFLNNSGNDEGRGASLIRVGDDANAYTPQLTIKGGTFTQDNFVVIKVDRGILWITGGEINSKNSYTVESWGPTANITGGTINGTVVGWTYSKGNDSTLNISGGTINGGVRTVNYGKTTEKTVKVEITGGTINGALGTYVYNGKYDETPNGTLATIGVTGGTFSEDPSAYLTDVATVKKNADDTFTAEKAYLAKVGETSYYTMDEAFKAQTASKEAIVLLRDYTTASVFNSGSIARVIDLNGHTWTYTQTDNNYAAFEINYSDASVTVKNGTVVSGSMIGLIPSASSKDGTITYNNSALVFENVNMTANGHSGFETNGLNTNDAITLKNCTLTVSNGYGIYFPSSGVITIEDTTIIAKTTGVQVCSGSLDISGSTKIEVKGEVVAKTENDGAIEDGAAVSVVNRSGYKELGNVTISGGTFVSTNGAAIKAYSWANKSESAFDNSDKIIAVTGGTFSDKVAAEYCADGFRVAKNGDTYAVVEKYIVSSQVTLGVDISFKYRVEKEGISKVEVSYYGVGATEPTVYELTAENGVYTFTGITPQMIDRKISVTVYVGKYEIYDVVDYSVLDYLKEVLAMNKGGTTDKLVASLAYYGKAAMDYVGYDTAEVEKFITDNALQQSDDEISGVAQSTGKIVKVAVKFDSQNKFVIAVADDVADKYAYTIKVNGKEVENIGWQSGIIDGYKVYLTEGIAARYITEEYFVEVSVKDGDKEVQTLKYNVAGYCANLKGDATFGEMAKATYYYGVAAGEYAKDQNI